MNGISIYDIIVLAVLALLTIRGGIKGVTMQLVSLASLILSWISAVQFSRLLAPNIGLEEPWNRVAAMLIMFLGTYIAIWIAFRFVSGMISGVKLKEFDRQMGALIGFLKGVAVCMIITFFAVSMEWSRASVYESKSGYYLSQAIDKAKAVVPEDIVAHIKEKLKKYHLDADDFPEDEDMLTEQGNADLFGIKKATEQVQEAGRIGSLISDVKNLFSENGNETQQGSPTVTNNRSTASTVQNTPVSANLGQTGSKEENSPGLTFTRPESASARSTGSVVPYESREGTTDSSTTRERTSWNPKLWSKAFQETKE